MRRWYERYELCAIKATHTHTHTVDTASSEGVSPNNTCKISGPGRGDAYIHITCMMVSCLTTARRLANQEPVLLKQSLSVMTLDGNVTLQYAMGAAKEEHCFDHVEVLRP